MSFVHFVPHEAVFYFNRPLLLLAAKLFYHDTWGPTHVTDRLKKGHTPPPHIPPPHGHHAAGNHVPIGDK